jgi:hypothetical protein
MPKTKRGRPLSPEWVNTATAAQQLGMCTKHLRKLRNDGFFKEGQHWRDIRSPGAARATYQWNLAQCERMLETPAEQR